MGIKETIQESKICKFIKKNLHSCLMVFGVFIGVILGIALRYSRDEPWTNREVMYVGFIGEIYLRMLRMLILPLILSSIVSAIGNIDMSLSKHIAVRAMVYYLMTSIVAVIIGILLAVSIKPGRYGSSDETAASTESEHATSTGDNISMGLDLIRNLFPPNVVQACFETFRSTLTPPDKELVETQDLLTRYNVTEVKDLPLDEWNDGGQYDPATNIMGLLVFCAALGIALLKLKEKGKPLFDFFHSLADVSMVLTGWVVKLSPLGMLFIMAEIMLEADNLTTMIGQVGMYFLTVIVGSVFHGFVILPALYYIIIRENPYTFIFGNSKALGTAFITSTSAGTLPVTLDCLENECHIDQRITRFVAPIGATVNMDGQALYEAVAALFIAQRHGIALSIARIISISVVSTISSIGAAGIPSAGGVTMIMILNAVGLPIRDIGLIISVDWFLDRVRTAINVLGDCIGTAIIYHMSKIELERLEEKSASFENVKLERIKHVYLQGGPRAGFQ